MTPKSVKDIRLLLVDDHAVLRQGVRSLLEDHPRIKVVGEAENGKEAIDLLKDLTIDVVLMDLEMPIMNGDEAFVIIRKRFPEVKVIILSMHYTHSFVTDFMSKGAGSYLAKGSSIEIIEKAICSVYDKGHYFDESCSVAMCNDLKLKSSFIAFEKTALSPREIEILKLLCDDKTNKEIGMSLNIEPRTVDFHRQNIYKKTNCKKPAGLALYAVKNGIISAS